MFISSFVQINYHEVKVRRGGPTTKDAPNLIPFNEERRVVGCICTFFLICLILKMSILGHEETHHISYLLLYKGIPIRCKCGHWFKLVDFNEYEAARDRYWKKIESKPENVKLIKELDDAEAELKKLLEESKSMNKHSAGSTEMLDQLV